MNINDPEREVNSPQDGELDNHKILRQTNKATNPGYPQSTYWSLVPYFKIFWKSKGFCMENYQKRGVEPPFQIQIQEAKTSRRILCRSCLILEGFWNHQSIAIVHHQMEILTPGFSYMKLFFIYMHFISQEYRFPVRETWACPWIESITVTLWWAAERCSIWKVCRSPAIIQGHFTQTKNPRQSLKHTKSFNSSNPLFSESCTRVQPN